MEVGMKRLIVVLLAGLAGCNDQPAAIAPQGPPGAQVSCISLNQVVSRTPLPPSAVLFEMTGGITWRADLQGNCAARADRASIVQTESHSTRLCHNDRIRIYDPVEAKATGARSFPACRIVGFTAVPGH
jgi:hypothetical protein